MNDQTHRITAIVPCFGRPERTKRIAECLTNQTINNYEVFFIGDNCPDFQSLLDVGFWSGLTQEAEKKGNKIVAINFANHFGGYGYHARSLAPFICSSPYLCYVDNDDVVLPNHLENYLSGIEGTDLDWVYYNTFNEAIGLVRDSKASPGLIGHAELCIRTGFAATLEQEKPEYGHDWAMIQEMMSKTDKYKKIENPHTYIIKGTPAKREQGID